MVVDIPVHFREVFGIINVFFQETEDSSIQVDLEVEEKNIDIEIVLKVVNYIKGNPKKTVEPI